MFDTLHTINSINTLDDNYGLKLLSEVASILSQNDYNTQCYARTSKATRCTNHIANPSINQLDISNMYCKQHCMTCERTTRNKKENSLLYGDVRLIGENCIPKSCKDQRFIKYMKNNKLLSDNLRISNNYKNSDNKHLFNRLCGICVS